LVWYTPSLEVGIIQYVFTHIDEVFGCHDLFCSGRSPVEWMGLAAIRNGVGVGVLEDTMRVRTPGT